MKKFLVIIVLIFAFLACRSQDSIPFVYNNMDDVITNLQDWGRRTTPWRNGILHLGNGIINDTTLQRGFTLIFYDTLGTVQWEKVYSDSQYYKIQGNDILAIDSNFFYVGGVYYDPTANPWDSFIAKFDQYGDTIYFHRYQDTASIWIIDLEKYSADTMLILSVWQEEMNDALSKIVLSYADLNSNIMLSMKDSLRHYIPREILCHDDQIFVGGSKITADNHSKIFINRYDLDFHYLGTTSPSLTLNEYFRSFTISENKLFLTSCISLWFPPDPRVHWSINISRLTDEGVLIDTNTFGPHHPWMEFGAETININDELLVTYINGSDVYLYFHDADLNPLCNYIFPQPAPGLTFAYIYDIAYLPPNKITGNGMTFLDAYAGIQNQWNFLSDDILSFIYSNCPYVHINEPSYETSKFQVLPNPVTSFATVRNHKEDLNCEVLLKLFDINGRLILSEIFYHETMLNVSDLDAGMYILHFSYNNQIEIHKMIKY